MRLPSLFISHGAPDLLLSDAPARVFLERLIDDLAVRPRAIVVASAHWETPGVEVSGAPWPATIHDFAGFPQDLYAVRYPAPGAPALAVRIAGLLQQAGMTCEIRRERGLDHGAWVPLALMAPSADIPVLQVSLQTHQGPGHHLRLGAALAPLRGDGVLIIGSGSLTHDLSSFFTHRFAPDAPAPDWVQAFADWVDAALRDGDAAQLADYRRRAPFAARNHPTEEHLAPLFVALGAAGDRPPIRRLHTSTTYGVLRMDAYAFGGLA